MKAIDLGSEKTWPVIRKLVLPAMAAQIVNVLYSIVDRIFVSQIGSAALSGIAVCSPLVTTLTAFSFWVGLGGGPLFSMRLGEKKDGEAKKLLSNAFQMLLLFGLLLEVVFFLALKPVLFAFGASENSYPYARDYMMIVLAGILFPVLTLGLNEFLSAQGMSLGSMLSTSISCLCNIAFDALFVLCFNWGVKGAAYATILCQGVGFLVSLLLLLKKSTRIRLSFGKPDFRIWGSILKLGFSPFIIMVTDSLLLLLFNTTFQKYGGEKEGDFLIEASTIVTGFESLITGPLLGISTGSQPILGYNYGAGREDLIRKSEKQIFLFGLCFTTVCFLLSYPLARPFADLFVRFQKGGSSSDKELLVDTSVKYIRIYMYGIIPLSLQYTTVDGLTGMGQANSSIWLSLNRKAVLMLGSMIILPLLTRKAESTFYAELIADIGSAVVSTLVYFLLFPKVMKKMKQKEPNFSLLKAK